MSSQKRLRKVAARFRREQPRIYAICAIQCRYLANEIRKHGTSDK